MKENRENNKYKRNQRNSNENAKLSSKKTGKEYFLIENKVNSFGL